MNRQLKRTVITFLPVLIVITVFFLRDYIFKLSFLLPPCPFYEKTGLLCPGCGNTRAVRALLTLHPLSALKYNASIPVLSVFAILLYAQYVVSAWVKPVRLVPKSYSFYITLGAVFIVYCIARNFI